jgi:hypothetical protein
MSFQKRCCHICSIVVMTMSYDFAVAHSEHHDPIMLIASSNGEIVSRKICIIFGLNRRKIRAATLGPYPYLEIGAC